MEYVIGEIIPFDFEQNGTQFGSKLIEKLSTRSFKVFQLYQHINDY